MRHISSLAAVSLAVLASAPAFGGFSYSFTKTDLNASLDQVIVRVLNDGVATGTKLNALNLTFQMTGASKSYFFVDDTDLDGTADQVQIPNAGNSPPNQFGTLLSTNSPFVRLGTASDTFVVSSDPTKNVVQPNPWLGGVNNFSVTATTLNAPTANTGTGTAIARLIIDNGAGITITGTVGGDTGAATVGTNNVYLGDVVAGVAPVFGAGSKGGSDARQSAVTTVNLNPGTDTYTMTIDFGNLGSLPSNFAIDTHVTGDAPINVQAGTVVTAPNNAGALTGLSIAGGVVSGTVNGAYRGTITIPLTATNAAGTDAATLTIIAIPEPATLGLLSGVGLLALRRRK